MSSSLVLASSDVPCNLVGLMANERLRAALARSEVSQAALAEAVGVDEKTVERWITKARTPHRRHRHAVATLLDVDAAYLWPVTDEHTALAQNEILAFYPGRDAVPLDEWHGLVTKAEREIGIFADAFPLNDEDARMLLAEKARFGVRVRILLGDWAEEDSVNGEGRIRRMMALCRPLHAVDGVEVRLHDSVMHHRICRADEELLVNLHVPGRAGPVLHLHKLAGGEFASTFIDSFEYVWSHAQSMPTGA
jgi:transcriptional regulator with XRE-family HTH domain